MKKIYNNFAEAFEKEQNISPSNLRFVLKLSYETNWNRPSLFNKIIRDYEKNFEKLYKSDHLLLIDVFSKNNIQHQEVIQAAAKKISKRNLSNEEEIDLFNNLVNLGFVDQNWKELILNSMINDNQFISNVISNSASINTKLHTLVSLYYIGLLDGNNPDSVLYFTKYFR